MRIQHNIITINAYSNYNSKNNILVRSAQTNQIPQGALQPLQ